jgi:epoxyqueuosine reductase QueG
MQPTLLTEIPLRLDKPDPSNCTECKMSRRSLKKVATRKRSGSSKRR